MVGWRSLNWARAASLCLGLLLLAPSLRAEPEYQFSPVNQSSIATVAAYWNPIVGYVSQKSGVKLSLKIGRTSADTTAYVLAQEVDFAFTNHLFSPERDPLGWKVLARRNTPPLHGQIVVPADSPINDIAQLKGLDVGLPGPRGLHSPTRPPMPDPASQVDVKVVFGGNMDGAFAQLFSGKVAAVGANSQLVEGYAKRGQALQVLWARRAFTTWR